jgi:hypothetical protein
VAFIIPVLLSFSLAWVIARRMPKGNMLNFKETGSVEVLQK